MKETLSRIYFELGDVINGISSSEYLCSPLVSYVNDSLSTLTKYLDFVISLAKD